MKNFTILAILQIVFFTMMHIGIVVYTIGYFIKAEEFTIAHIMFLLLCFITAMLIKCAVDDARKDD